MKTLAMPLLRRIPAVLLGGALMTPPVQAAPLPEVVNKVLLQQPSVRSAQALLRAVDAQVTQVRSDFMPSLSLSYRNSEARDETQGRPVDRTVRRSDANLRWNVFNGAADTSRLASIRFNREAAESDLDGALESVAFEITEAYCDVIRLRQTVSSLQATIERQQSVSANVAKRVEAGRIPSAEHDLIQVRLIQNQTALGQMRAQLATAELRYRLLTGEAPEGLISPALQAGEATIDSEFLLERIQERNPRLRGALQRVAAKQQDIGAVRGSFFPAVDLSLAQRLSNTSNPYPVSDNDRTTQVLVSIDIPLGGKNIGRYVEAVERHQSAQADADDLVIKLSRDITELQGQYREAHEIAPSLEKRVVSAQRVAAAYELHFNAGRRSLNDLSIAQDDLFNAQRALIENRAQLMTIQAQLLSLAGGLRDALQQHYRSAPIPAGLLGTTPYSAELAAAPVPTIAALPMPPMDVEPAAVAQAATPAQRLNTWRAAWASGDYAAYRSHYARDFHPDGGRKLEAWEIERRQRLAQAAGASITIEGLHEDTRGNDRIVQRFVQHYTAPRFRDTVRKQLEWARRDGQWQIVAETVLPANAAEAPR